MRSPAPFAVLLALPLLAGALGADPGRLAAPPAPQSPSGSSSRDVALHRPFDEMLDLYVRGAAGSGRLRSEAYVAGDPESQLKAVAAEVVTRPVLFAVDQTAGQTRLSSIFGWHEADFAAAHAAGADARFANRAPFARAAVAFAMPNLLEDEAAFVNKNTFQVGYSPFDWRLNDLASRQ